MPDINSDTDLLDDFRTGWEGGLANLDAHVASLMQGAPR